MTREKRKVHKMRGGKRGYGSKKKHRGKGSQGGSGHAGLWDHKKTYVLKNEPERFKKRGFKSLYQKNMKIKEEEITLRDAVKLAAGKKEIDVKALGYGKVIGRRISGPLTVKARSFSEGAKAAIETAGGKAEVV